MANEDSKKNKTKNRNALLSKKNLIFVIVQLCLIVFWSLCFYGGSPATTINTKTVSGNVEKIEYDYYKGIGFKQRRVLVVFIDGLPYNLAGELGITNQASYDEILDTLDIGEEITLQYIDKKLFSNKVVVDMRNKESVFRSIKTYNQRQVPLMFFLSTMLIICEFILIGFFYFPEVFVSRLQLLINSFAKSKTRHKS